MHGGNAFLVDFRNCLTEISKASTFCCLLNCHRVGTATAPLVTVIHDGNTFQWTLGIVQLKQLKQNYNGNNAHPLKR